ncbi:MAG: UDP-N-acetylmuramate dehydrogenase [Chitinophagales bacterium]|nr:UDP-N-acetylmuramate dehydrogenase [Chitinophagales bacterium]MDW8428567.1 UDP-N-acetylmuramate dehydrogenase [Chitinophagales bacterium]
MTLAQHVSLRPYNTFGVEAKARWFASIRHSEDLIPLMQHECWNGQRLVLGGGSNILFATDYEGLILHNQLTGVSIVEQDDESVTLRVASGENWHDLVCRCVASGWSGLENLALIPGSVGAAPIQNIGAYGAEFKDICRQVEFIYFDDGKKYIYEQQQCRFAYRDSVFKHELHGRCFITAVTVKLSKRFRPNLSYGALKQFLESRRVIQPDLQQVFEAVVALRKSKLPDPEQLGNAGSFFKNPVLAFQHAERLRRQYSDLPVYLQGETAKIPAGWLIEQCGWKGRRLGQAGVYERQALVLVNHGGASGADLLELASRIQQSVYEKFGIWLEPEVNIIGSNGLVKKGPEGE